MTLVRSYLIRYGIEYYIAARMALDTQLVIVIGSLFHHSLELFLKAYLVDYYSLEQLKIKFSHRLIDLWDEFIKVSKQADSSLLKDCVAHVDKFESIRYPGVHGLDGIGIFISYFQEDVAISVFPDARKNDGNYLLMVSRIDDVVENISSAGNWKMQRYYEEYKVAIRALNDPIRFMPSEDQ